MDRIRLRLSPLIANLARSAPSSPISTPCQARLLSRKPETTALIHDRVTEIYQITEGSGTIVTGGSLENATATDLTRLNAGPSHTGTHKGGESKHVGVKDVIIIPAGMPHRFSQLDGPAIVYLVYRFEPKP